MKKQKKKYRVVSVYAVVDGDDKRGLYVYTCAAPNARTLTCGHDAPEFVEMSSWFVRDMERTGTPYMFLAMDESQCDSVETMIENALAKDKDKYPDNLVNPNAAPVTDPAPEVRQCKLLGG